MTRALTTLMMLGLLVAAAAAQEKPQQTPQPKAPTTAASEKPGQPVNISLEITISEQAGSGEPIRKSVKILAADGMSGRIRSQVGSGPFGRLNVDVRPRLIDKDRILTNLIVEYQPRRTEAETPSDLHESLTVFLQSGEPLTVAQSADPNADRIVSLEVRATVLR